jgi:hypothetical protein
LHRGVRDQAICALSARHVPWNSRRDELGLLVKTLEPARQHAQLIELEDLVERAVGKGDAEALADDVEDLVDLLGIEADLS